MKHNISEGIVVLLLIPCFTGYAQHQFVEGFIVTNAGDTITGYIEQRERDASVNPSLVNFKSSADGVVKTYPVEDVSYFSSKGIAAYRRFTVSISMDPVELRNALGYAIPDPEVKPVFLRILQEGNVVSLFSYQDELKIRFYLLDYRNDIPEELVYRLIKVNSTYREGFEFRNVLTSVADRAGMLSDKLEFQIQQCTYRGQPIISVVSSINGVEVKKVKIDRMNSGLFGGGGRGNSMVRFFGEEVLSQNATSSVKPYWWGMVGYDIALNPYVGVFVFRASFSYNLDKVEIRSYDHTFQAASFDLYHQFLQRTISVDFKTLVYLFNHPEVSIYGSLGFKVNHSTYSNDFIFTRTSTNDNVVHELKLPVDGDEVPRNYWEYFPIELGVVLKKKVDVQLMYSVFPTVLNQGYYPSKYHLNSFWYGVRYHF